MNRIRHMASVLRAWQPVEQGTPACWHGSAPLGRPAHAVPGRARDALSVMVTARWPRARRCFGSAKAPEKILEVEKDSKKMMVPNPDYAVWRDQHVLTYLVTSLSREVLAAVASNMTVVDMWVVISMIFASQSRSLILHLYNQLVATRKGELSVTSYFSSMCGYANEMAAAGKPLDNDDIVSYILNGLDADYNSLIE
jgi:hypothetical protein